MADADQLLGLARYQGMHQGTPFEVRLVPRGPGLCLVFAGPVPMALPSAVMGHLQRALAAHPGTPAFADLSTCTYLGSGAIACLMEYLRFVSPRGGGAMPVVNPHPRALTVLRMLGLSNFFVSQPDDAAVARWFEEQTRR